MGGWDPPNPASRNSLSRYRALCPHLSSVSTLSILCCVLHQNSGTGFDLFNSALMFVVQTCTHIHAVKCHASTCGHVFVHILLRSKALRVRVATQLWMMPQLLMRRSAHRFTMLRHQNCCWYRGVSNHCKCVKEALDVSHPGGFHWGLACHLKHLLPVVFGQVGNSKEVHCHHQQ